MNRELALHFALHSDDGVEVGILGGDNRRVLRRLAGADAAGILPALATGGAAGRGAAGSVVLASTPIRARGPNQ